jgi:muramoyltetrapeptide carboxypeptidase LdcA involved in peptidoglycan recycling
MIWCASGGEILIDMLPYIDLDNISRNIKWIQGYSDPSTLLYLVTTKLDIATIYGINAGGLDQDNLHSSLEYNLELLKGNISKQNSYEYYEKTNSKRKDNNEYNLNTKVKWISNKENIDITGRLIGGCIDALNDIIGSNFDYTLDFVEKYYKDGIIWYFDIYSMSSIQLYRTLFHMKYTGWFKYSKCFIFGRVLFSNEEFISYYEAIEKILEDIPFIMDTDIGHTSPKMTLINGSICNIKYKDNKGNIELILK